MIRSNVLIYALCISISFIFTNDTEILHNYFWANYNQFKGNNVCAHKWYTKLFTLQPSPYSYKGYLTILADANVMQNFEKIVQLMPSLGNKFKNDPEIQLIFATALEKTNRTQEANSHIIMLSQSFRNNAEITLRAAQVYIRRQEYNNALLTIDAFLNNTPRKANNFIFYFLKTQIYTSLGNYNKALESITTCVEMHPRFDKSWLLYASLYEKEGNIQKAVSGYSTFLELSGSNKEIEKHLFALMLKQKNSEDTKQRMLSHAVSIDNALVLFKQQRYDQALTHINACIEHQPFNEECKLLKIQILSMLKDFKDIASTISTWIMAQPENSMWPKTICLLAYNGMPIATIIDTLTTVIQKNPHNLWCNLYCADMYMRNGQSNNAITYLSHALHCTMADTRRATILYQRALLHYEHNNHLAMHNDLKSAHNLNKECPHINNTLAYYWATKGKDIQKAQSFIEKALAIDSKNPHFLDTQALILYKEKKYLQAEQILEKLISYNNGTILLRLAKVHYALNNNENADIFTKKAQLVIHTTREKKTLKKMQLLLART
ncbi:MAG TPA: hypothetical protein VLB80_04960 [Candidatus Babeliales bacterium]|nr:hypothetical protein [Candidatus Babeliales bacterium]